MPLRFFKRDGHSLYNMDASKFSANEKTKAVQWKYLRVRLPASPARP
jgi:hypothetical protein